MSVSKFKMLSNKVKAVLIGSAIALIGLLAIAPAVVLASPLQELLPAPQSLKPKNNALSASPSPTFSWTAVSGAVSYNLEISVYPDFDFSQDLRYTTTETSVQVFPLSPGVYYWRVGASDADSNVGAYSEVRTLTIHQKNDPLPGVCPVQSSNSYESVPVEQYDLDDPVRYAADNADKNPSLRGLEFRPDQPAEFLDYGPPSDNQMPPQLATLFGAPYRVPQFGTRWKVGEWTWDVSPEPGFSNGILDNVAVHGLGLVPETENQSLHSPRHGRNLGSPVGQGGAVVLYADANSITLKFSREDSVATGYTMHFMFICTDPNLVSLYQSLDNADRNSFGEGSGNTPQDGVFDYSLPGLHQGQVFGTSFGNEDVVVFIRDVGTFLDPRSITEWWQLGN